MLPIALMTAILPALIQLVPQLGKIFGSGSDTQVRNVEAATAVLEVAKEAIGARNEQEMFEQIQTDSQAAALVKEAIEKNYLKIEEIGGGVESAREFALATTVIPEGSTVTPLRQQPAFVVSMVMMSLVIFATVIVLMPWEIWREGGEQVYSDEMRLIIVTALFTGVLGAISGFWLGTTFGSKTKDAALANSTAANVVNANAASKS